MNKDKKLLIVGQIKSMMKMQEMIGIGNQTTIFNLLILNI